MGSVIYQLDKLKRLTGFEYTLDEVGLMVNHCAIHRNNKLSRFFFCFGFNRDKYSPAEDSSVSFGLLTPGMVLNTNKRIAHDELFFSFPERLNDKLQYCFGDFIREKRIHCTLPDKKEFELYLTRIRSLLQSRLTLGTADQLDVLAMQMILGAIGIFASGQSGTAPVEEQPDQPDNKVLLIAEGLKEGENLQNLIRKYGYSRRAFYYEWKKHFSVSPKELLLDAKLERAQRLLLYSSLQISEIAEQCHFSSHRYFHECFLKHFSCTPGEYRKRYTS